MQHATFETQDFGYTIAQGDSYWKTGPTTFPAFAEYSMDTGTTIRAFIPFTGADDRSRLRKYKGKMVVWDARVVCQKPGISESEVHRMVIRIWPSAATFEPQSRLIQSKAHS